MYFITPGNGTMRDTCIVAADKCGGHVSAPPPLPTNTNVLYWCYTFIINPSKCIVLITFIEVCIVQY